MPLKIILFVFAAGGVGTLARFLVVKAFPAEHLFLSTFAVNLTGSFLAGFLSILLRQRFPACAPYAPVILIGFLGAFTTFSTLMLESANMIFSGEYGKAAWNLALQNLTGFLAVIGGIFLGRLV